MTSNSEKELRQEFEDWASHVCLELSSTTDGEYLYHSTHCAWMAWRAARERYQGSPYGAARTAYGSGKTT